MVLIKEEGRKMAEAAAIEAWVRCGSRKQWRLANDSKQVEMKAVVALLLYGLKVAYEDLGAGSEGRKMWQQGWQGRKGDGKGDYGSKWAADKDLDMRSEARKMWQQGWQGKKGDDRGDCDSKRVKIKIAVRLLLRGLKVAYKDLDPDSEGRNMRWQGWEGRKGDGRGDWGIIIGTPRIAALIQIDRTPKVSIDALIPIDRTP
ncbi:hypothetical protein B296_00011948 [Ensete ventricosum]|uniref:Uncharacterized protein n=1 Tax=Ensete ventricosum TaxID=4639 RepID=A0A427B7Q2_ENSVE|nr:hypothetical protein B296_00011948 [Ensete ventricosum]